MPFCGKLIAKRVQHGQARAPKFTSGWRLHGVRQRIKLDHDVIKRISLIVKDTVLPEGIRWMRQC